MIIFKLSAFRTSCRCRWTSFFLFWKDLLQSSPNQQELLPKMQNGAPSGVFQRPESRKSRHFRRKVGEKVGARDIETNGAIPAHLAPAFHVPCNGGAAPCTPTNQARFCESVRLTQGVSAATNGQGSLCTHDECVHIVYAEDPSREKAFNPSAGFLPR